MSNSPDYFESAYRPSKYNPFIYFIQQGRDGPIKIGISGDPDRRMRQLQTAQVDQLYMLLMIPGSTKSEAHFHRTFNDLCLGGEWFANHPAIQELIRRLRLHVYGQQLKRLHARLAFCLVSSRRWEALGYEARAARYEVEADAARGCIHRIKHGPIDSRYAAYSSFPPEVPVRMSDEARRATVAPF